MGMPAKLRFWRGLNMHVLWGRLPLQPPLFFGPEDILTD